MFFVELKKPNGKRMLVNLDLVLVIDEAEGGAAEAVSNTGTRVPLPESFEFVMREFMGEVKP